VSPKWSLSLMFPHQNPVYNSPLPHSRYMTSPSHSCPRLALWTFRNKIRTFLQWGVFSTSPNPKL
jgi:hypothetical protein